MNDNTSGRGGSRGWRRQALILAAAVAGIALLAACGGGGGGSGSSGALASAYIYWADNTHTIGRASLNGTGVNQRFLTVRRGRPYGLAVNPGP